MARPEGPKSKAGSAGTGGALGEGIMFHSSPARGLGKRCKLPQ